MSDISSLLGPTATLIAAISGAVTGFLAYRKSLHVESKVTEVHLELNSRLTELVDAKAEAARAEGHAIATDALAAAAGELAAAKAEAVQRIAEALATQPPNADSHETAATAAINAVADKLNE